MEVFIVGRFDFGILLKSDLSVFHEHAKAVSAYNALIEKHCNPNEDMGHGGDSCQVRTKSGAGFVFLTKEPVQT